MNDKNFSDSSNFVIADAYTVDDVIYNWNNRGSKAIEVFAAELAQFDMLQIVTSKKANTNSKGEAFRGLKHFCGGGAREKGSTVREGDKGDKGIRGQGAQGDKGTRGTRGTRG